MSTSKKLPRHLIEAVRYFSDLDVANDFLAQMRWPDGPTCPVCGSTEYSYLTTRRVYKCKQKECRKQYTVKLGTIFSDSPLGLDKWLPAVWLVANSKNGISSHELGRALGTTQKSAWFMVHRIRLAMQTGTFDKLDGEVEVDESYIGGKARNMHKSARERKAVEGWGKGKTIAFGMRTRDGKVRATVVPDTRQHTVHRQIDENIERGATLYTDAHSAYKGLDDVYAHQVVDHAEAYVDGRVHTNGIENFWSLLKRGLHGTYVSVEAFHLFRYLDERVFTYNLRDLDDYGRFAAVLRAVTGRRLTYAELTGRA